MGLKISTEYWIFSILFDIRFEIRNISYDYRNLIFDSKFDLIFAIQNVSVYWYNASDIVQIKDVPIVVVFAQSLFRLIQKSSNSLLGLFIQFCLDSVMDSEGTPAVFFFR